MEVVAFVLCTIGVILWATPVWFAALMEFLFRRGIGYRRLGTLRRIRMTEWLNASGVGIFFGSLAFGLGRFLLHAYAGR